MGRRGKMRRDRDRKVANPTTSWQPRTRLGRMVHTGEISTMSEALSTHLPLREAEIVDVLLPDTEGIVLDVNMVQRMTDSGRRVRFAITTVVGNKDGFVGLGKSKGKEVGPMIMRAMDSAKLNIIEVRRGCGSWECGCGSPHSLPYLTIGKGGSVRFTLKPAPQGVGLAVGEIARNVLDLAGIKDAWGFTEGKTKTTINFALAAYDALKQNTLMRVSTRQDLNLAILRGAKEAYVVERNLGEDPSGLSDEEVVEVAKEAVKGDSK